jgi:cell division protein FtsW
MVAIHTMINIAVVTSSMPVTGLQLPFISYGGNFLLMLMISMGIMLNISKQSKSSPPE